MYMQSLNYSPLIVQTALDVIRQLVVLFYLTLDGCCFPDVGGIETIVCLAYNVNASSLDSSSLDVCVPGFICSEDNLLGAAQSVSG